MHFNYHSWLLIIQWRLEGRRWVGEWTRSVYWLMNMSTNPGIKEKWAHDHAFWSHLNALTRRCTICMTEKIPHEIDHIRLYHRIPSAYSSIYISFKLFYLIIFPQLLFFVVKIIIKRIIRCGCIGARRKRSSCCFSQSHCYKPSFPLPQFILKFSRDAKFNFILTGIYLCGADNFCVPGVVMCLWLSLHLERTFSSTLWQIANWVGDLIII